MKKTHEDVADSRGIIWMSPTSLRVFNYDSNRRETRMADESKHETDLGSISRLLGDLYGHLKESHRRFCCGLDRAVGVESKPAATGSNQAVTCGIVSEILQQLAALDDLARDLSNEADRFERLV